MVDDLAAERADPLGRWRWPGRRVGPGGHSVAGRLPPKCRGAAHRLVLHASDVGGSAPRV